VGEWERASAVWEAECAKLDQGRDGGVTNSPDEPVSAGCPSTTTHTPSHPLLAAGAPEVVELLTSEDEDEDDLDGANLASSREEPQPRPRRGRTAGQTAGNPAPTSCPEARPPRAISGLMSCVPPEAQVQWVGRGLFGKRRRTDTADADTSDHDGDDGGGGGSDDDCGSGGDGDGGPDATGPASGSLPTAPATAWFHPAFRRKPGTRAYLLGARVLSASPRRLIVRLAGDDRGTSGVHLGTGESIHSDFCSLAIAGPGAVVDAGAKPGKAHTDAHSALAKRRAPAINTRTRRTQNPPSSPRCHADDGILWRRAVGTSIVATEWHTWANGRPVLVSAAGQQHPAEGGGGGPAPPTGGVIFLSNGAIIWASDHDGNPEYISTTCDDGNEVGDMFEPGKHPAGPTGAETDPLVQMRRAWPGIERGHVSQLSDDSSMLRAGKQQQRRRQQQSDDEQERLELQLAIAMSLASD
jgi:hypothetical protein